jgi:hypothetical protein
MPSPHLIPNKKKSVLLRRSNPSPQPPTLFPCQGPVAQVAERTPDKGEVSGSSPDGPTIFGGHSGQSGFEPKGP